VRKAFALALLSPVILSGCQSSGLMTSPMEPGHEEWAPTLISPSEAKRNPGSLYSEGHQISLFQDRRAYRVGDVLTVILDENTKSSKDSDTSMDRSTDVSVEAPTLGKLSLSELTAALRSNRSFSGEASATQRNSLSGSITVTVARTFPNGILEIQGEKWIKLNQGDEFVRLKGLVRVDDINDNNQVASERIANAQITYAGRGALADSNEPGWLTRFLQGPLMPF